MNHPGRPLVAFGVALALALVVSACEPHSSDRAAPGAQVRSPTSLPGATCSGPTAQPRSRVIDYAALPSAATFSEQVAAAAGRIVQVGPQAVRFTDFGTLGSPSAGGVLGPAATGLVGAGPDRTVFEMTPHTSTHAADVPVERGAANQLSLLTILGDHAVLRGFGVVGTDQGHLYNGLRVARISGLRASDIEVVGIPGDNSSPPGETFGINDFRTVGSHCSDVEVDGAGVGASGFGVNGSKDIELCDVDSHDNPTSMGFAFWQTDSARLVDCTAVDNGYSGFNFERSTGTNVLIRPIATRNRFAMRIASDEASARFRIIDPVLIDGHWTVTLPTRWNGSPNRQRRRDITLIVDGKPRPDLLRFDTY